MTFDKPTARVVALVALLILAAAALRGYLPAHHGSRLTESSSNKTALLFLVAAIAATLALLAFSIIARLRDPRAVAPSAGDPSGMLGRGGTRPSWRVVLIALAVIVAWSILVIVLSRLFTPPDVALDAPQSDPSQGPASSSGAAPKPKHPLRHKDSDDMLASLLAFVPVLLMLFVGGFIASRRKRSSTVAETDTDEHAELPSPETTSKSLVRAAEVGLAEMTDLSREPREAIIACYAAMERELANVPGAVPQEFDTPTEVLARAVDQRALHADNAVQLVNLFEEARFSPHVMNEDHRETAVHVLELVLQELVPRSGASR